ncbi:MAG: thiolase family protein [Alphaproteobacteria bacterium]
MSVAIAGSAMRPFGRSRDGSSPRDWIGAVSAAALADAAVDRGDVDALVVGVESDHLSLQLSPAALAADAIGLDCPAVRVEMGGATGAAALHAGAMRILAGAARIVLVVGVEHASQLAPAEVRRLYGLSFDADIEGMAGIEPVHLYALSIGAHMAAHGTTARDLAAVAVKNRSNAALNPNAHRREAITVDAVLASPVVSTPYRTLDCSPLSDGAVALVLARADAAPRTGRRTVRIAGMGSATDALRLGDRPAIHRFDGKRRAAAAAYRMAGIEAPSHAIDVAEVYDAFSGAELQSIEALGLAPDGAAARALADGAFAPDGRLPVNLSGGLIGQGGAPGATGLAQAATLARILEGRYWPGLQPARSLQRALADAHSGIATVSVVTVLEGA